MEQLLQSFGIDGRILFWQAINFGVLFAVLWFLLYKPLRRIMKDREDKVRESLEGADKLETKSKELETRRLEAIDLIIAKKQSQTAVTKKLGVSVRAVQYWIHTYRSAGKKGLHSVPRSGRPARLTPARKKQLARILLAGALKAGFSTDLWTSPRVACLIRQKWGVTYHVDHVLRLLYSLGFTPQKSALEDDGL